MLIQRALRILYLEQNKIFKMVRVITQQTFNDVVKENMEEFDMSMAEAVQEAVQQFEAQGVDLSNVVIGVDLGLSNEPITQCVLRLQQNAYEGNIDRLCGDLKFFQEECNKELAKKILAGKEGAYGGLIKLLETYKDNKQVEILLFQALIALMTGYPDLLDENGVNILASVITKSKDMEIIKNALKWCRECCIKHENNRQAIFNSYTVRGFGPLLETSAVKEVCAVVRSLCLDDDIRVQVSKAHEHARSLAVDLLCPLTSLLNKYKTQKEELTEILLTMSTLMVRHEFCAKVDDANGLDLISDIISAYDNDEKINRTCFNLLKTLVGNDDVKAHVFQKITLVTLVMHSIERHKGKSACAAAGLGLLAALALRSPSNSQIMCELNAPEIIISAMKIHPTDSSTQRRGCWAIRNIVSRRKDLSTEFIKLGVEELLTNVIKSHKDCHDDAKAALRDLGCDVKLIERWTGKGPSLKN